MRRKQRVAFFQMLREHASGGDYRHKIGVAIPSRHHMPVHMVRKPGPCRTPEISPNVKCGRTQHRAQAFDRERDPDPPESRVLRGSTVPVKPDGDEAPPSDGHCCMGNGSTSPVLAARHRALVAGSVPPPRAAAGKICIFAGGRPGLNRPSATAPTSAGQSPPPAEIGGLN